MEMSSIVECGFPVFLEEVWGKRDVPFICPGCKKPEEANTSVTSGNLILPSDRNMTF